MSLQINSEEREGLLIFRLTGSLDTNTSGRAFENFSSRIEEHSKKVLFNLQDLDFVSSAGLRILLQTAKTLESAGGSIKICHATGIVKEAFETSGFDNLLEIHDTENSAVAAF